MATNGRATPHDFTRYSDFKGLVAGVGFEPTTFRLCVYPTFSTTYLPHTVTVPITLVEWASPCYGTCHAHLQRTTGDAL